MWGERWESSVKDMTFNVILSQGLKKRPICPIQVFQIHTFLSLNLSWAKCLFETSGKVQMGCVLDKLIPNNDRIKILSFTYKNHWYRVLLPGTARPVVDPSVHGAQEQCRER